MKIAVLGCGPAGLLAAQACAEAGEDDITILSQKQKSPMPGAQYLHERIPGISNYEPQGYLQICKEGTAEGYAEKVYGDPSHPVSWDKYEAGHFPAWSLSDTYDKLWSMWESEILGLDVPLTYGSASKLCRVYDLVLSTIPATVLHDPEQDCLFGSQTVWFTDKAWRECPENTIIYNGEGHVPWYRTSSIFGHESTEYSGELRPAKPANKGFKPTKTNCQCAPSNVIKLGRFGKWDKQVLVHHAWEDARRALFALQ